MIGFADRITHTHTQRKERKKEKIHKNFFFHFYLLTGCLPATRNPFFFVDCFRFVLFRFIEHIFWVIHFILLIPFLSISMVCMRVCVGCIFNGNDHHHHHRIEFLFQQAYYLVNFFSFVCVCESSSSSFDCCCCYDYDDDDDVYIRILFVCLVLSLIKTKN